MIRPRKRMRRNSCIALPEHHSYRVSSAVSAFVLLTLAFGTSCTKNSKTEPPEDQVAAHDPAPTTSRSIETDNRFYEVLIADIAPKSLEEILASLSPIPHLDILLDKLSKAPETPRGALPEDVESKIKELENRIRTLHSTEAIPLAQRIAEIREKNQGRNHWQTTDALRRVAELKKIAALPPELETELRDAGRIFSLIDKLRRQEKFVEAAKHATLQLMTRRKVLGDKHSKTLTSLANLASLLGKAEDHKNTDSLHRAAITIRLNYLGKEHPEVATVLSNYAGLLKSGGEYKSAELLYRQALSIYYQTNGTAHVSTLSVLNNLASLLHHKGDLAEAELAYNLALAKMRSASERNWYIVATTQNNLATLCAFQGRLAASEVYLREALAIYQKALGEDHPRTIATMCNLAGLLHRRGDDAAAMHLYKSVFENRTNRSSTANAPEYALELNNYGLFLRSTGDLAGAEMRYLEALEIYHNVYGNEHVKVAAVLNNLAGIFHDRNHYDKAEKFYRESLEMRQRLLGAHHPDVILGLNNLADLYHSKGDYQQAQELFERVLTKRRKLFGDIHPQVAFTMKNLAHALLSSGELKEAARYLHKALEIEEFERTQVIGDERDRSRYSEKLGFTLTTALLSEILIELGRPKKALEILEQGRSRALLDLLARSERELIKDAQVQGSSQLRDELKYAINEENTARAAALSAEKMLMDTGPRSNQGEEERFQKRLKKVNETRRALRDAELRVLANLRLVWPDATPSTINEIKTSIGSTELMLCYTWTKYFITVLLVSPDEKGDSIEGYVLTRGPVEVQRVSKSVKEVRETLSNPPIKGKTANSRSNELFNLLLPTSIRKRVMAAERVIVIPDGPLNNLPFEALALNQDGGSQRLWLDNGPIVVYATSCSLYVNRRNLSTRKPNSLPSRFTKATGRDPSDESALKSNSMLSAVLLGDPVFDHPPQNRSHRVRKSSSRADDLQVSDVISSDYIRLYGGSLEPLPGTKKEVEAIGKIIETSGGSVKLLIGRNASLGKLEEVVCGKNILHLATHGHVGSMSWPYDASLALSSSEISSVEDAGFLTLDYLVRRWRTKLEHCNLVVLSACDTQRGIKVGDSIVALPWGFMYAGATTVVASLWKVDDTATALLMTRFYQNLLGQFDEAREIKGRMYSKERPMPVAEALNEAKNWLRSLAPKDVEVLARGGLASSRLRRREGMRDFTAPYYWSSFIVTGAQK
ncbi:MAG: CHAT domain-containing protein [Phycisphaerales bacterium]|nr:CHAT domain-containing protein [Phycisphaerales bacterium]